MQYINITAGTTYPLVLGDEVNAMNTAKIYLLCDTSSGSGAINILLPRITNGSSSLKNWWFEIFINDIGNNASVNNIKITPNPADTINGDASQITLSTNGATGRIVVTSKTAWNFNTGSSGSSGGGVAESIWSKGGGVFSISPVGANFYTFFSGTTSLIENQNVFFFYKGSSGSITQFGVIVSVNPSSTPTTITVRKNGVDTGMSITIPPTVIGYFQPAVPSASVPIANGDIFSIRASGNDAVISVVSTTVVAKVSV